MNQSGFFLPFKVLLCKHGLTEHSNALGSVSNYPDSKLQRRKFILRKKLGYMLMLDFDFEISKNTD